MSYYVYKRKMKSVYIIILSVGIIGVIINSWDLYVNVEKYNKKYSLSQQEEINEINEFIMKEESIEDKKDILLIGNTIVSLATLEVFLEYPYVFTTEEDFYKLAREEQGIIEFSKLELQSFHQYWTNNEMEEPTYIITNNKYNLRGYEIVLETQSYKVYRSNQDIKRVG